MESVLQTIIDALKKREEENFRSFSPDSFINGRKEKPVDILTILLKNFLYIFEIKKASPSKGIIREDFDPISILKDYENIGASAVSVITEPQFFLGDKKYLSMIKERTSLPVLRKDFLIHPFQIYEAYNMGADFVLLIAACLSESELKLLYDLTLMLDMNALVEVHNESELEKALTINPKIIGINNRDLKTFKVDLETSFRLKKLIPDNIFTISESGIKSFDDIKLLKENGFSGVLVGESLLREKNIVEAGKRLMHG